MNSYKQNLNISRLFERIKVNLCKTGFSLFSPMTTLLTSDYSSSGGGKVRPGAFLRTGSQKPLSVSLCAVRHRDTDGRRQQGRNADLFHQKYAGVYDLPQPDHHLCGRPRPAVGNTSGSNLTDCGSSLSWTPSGCHWTSPSITHGTKTSGKIWQTKCCTSHATRTPRRSTSSGICICSWTI